MSSSSSSNQNENYKPKTDTTQSVLLNDIQQYNKHLEHREFRKAYLQKPSEQLISASPRCLKQIIQKEKDEEAVNAEHALNHGQLVGIVIGNQIDKMQIKKIYRHSRSMDNDLNTWERLANQLSDETESMLIKEKEFLVIDKKKVTHGDLHTFYYYLNHPNAAKEELLNIRKETNAGKKNGGQIDYDKLGKNNRLRKQIDHLVDISEIKAFEVFAKKLDQELPHFLSPEQKKLLYQKESILSAHNSLEFTMNYTLIKKILDETSLGRKFFALDPKGLMNEKDIQRFLKGKLLNPSFYKFYLNFLQSSDEMVIVRGGLKAVAWNKRNDMAISRQKGKRAERGSIKKWAANKIKEEMIQDEEFAASEGFSEHSTNIIGSGFSAAGNAVKLTGKTTKWLGAVTEKMGASAGNMMAAGFSASGNEVAAEAVKALGEGIIRTKRKAKEKTNQIIYAPRRILHKAERQVIHFTKSGIDVLFRGMEHAGKAVSSTALGSALVSSRAWRAAKIPGKAAIYGIHQARRAVHQVSIISALPFCFFGETADFTKQWVIKPITLFIGLIILFQLLLAMIFSGMGGNSALSVVMLDSKEHFSNSDYTIPEEMGFQQRYEQSQTEFQAQIDGIINGYAQTLNKKGQQIPYGVNGANHSEGSQNQDYVRGVTMHFDSSKSNNLEDILSCVTVVMQQQQSLYHKEALELIDCFYQSSHTYNYTESSLYKCDSGCETTHYFCSEAKNNYPSTEMKFSPYLYEELMIPDEHHECEVDRNNPEMTAEQYTGCTVTGICYHNTGEEDDHFGRRKPKAGQCSHPKAYWDCSHNCNKDNCSHDCSRSVLGCAGYWHCGGHEHFGCLDGHEAKTCFGHVNLEMNIQIKSMEELFTLGGIERKETTGGRIKR